MFILLQPVILLSNYFTTYCMSKNITEVFNIFYYIT